MNRHVTKPGSQKMKIADIARYLLENLPAFRAMPKILQARFTLLLANLELAKLGYRDPVYARRLYEFNQAMIELTKAKWYTAVAMTSRSQPDWKIAFQSLRKAQALGQELERSIRTGDTTFKDHRKAVLSSDGAEITYADGIPLVPEINPIVILQGSDFEMGYQYAQQVIQIFGPWLGKAGPLSGGLPAAFSRLRWLRLPSPAGWSPRGPVPDARASKGRGMTVTDYMILIAIALVTAAVGAAVFFYWLANRKRLAKETVGRAEELAERTANDAERDAETKKKEALLEAKERAHEMLVDAERQARERRQQLSALEQTVTRRDEKLTERLVAIEQRDKEMRAQEQALGKREKATAEAAAKYERLVADQQREVQRVAN